MLDFLRGSRLVSDYNKSGTSATGKLFLPNGEVIKKKAGGGGYDRTNTTLANIIEQVVNENIDISTFKDFPETYGVRVLEDEIQIDGGTGGRCWRAVLEFLDIEVEDLPGDEYESYMLK